MTPHFAAVRFFSNYIKHTDHASDRIIKLDRSLWEAEGLCARVTALRLDPAKTMNQRSSIDGECGQNLPGFLDPSSDLLFFGIYALGYPVDSGF